MDDGEIRSLCVALLLSDSLCKQKSFWIITINGKIKDWKCKPICHTEITDLKRFLAGENTRVQIILATTVYIN